MAIFNISKSVSYYNMRFKFQRRIRFQLKVLQCTQPTIVRADRNKLLILQNRNKIQHSLKIGINLTLTYLKFHIHKALCKCCKKQNLQLKKGSLKKNIMETLILISTLSTIIMIITRITNGNCMKTNPFNRNNSIKLDYRKYVLHW